MNKMLSRWSAAFAVLVILPLVGLAQGPDLGTRVLALKQSLEKDQAALRKYEWIETTIVSYKGEEKANTQKRCYYGADGALQKVEVASSKADMPGGVRGRMAKRKKQDVTEYMQHAVDLIHQYVPANPATIYNVFQAGRTSIQILQPGRRGRLDFRAYLLPADVLGVEVNLTNNTMLGLQVGTYIDKPEDTVTLKVAFATLADGTGYPSQVTLDAVKQKVHVVTRNTGYRLVQP